MAAKQNWRLETRNWRLAKPPALRLWSNSEEVQPGSDRQHKALQPLSLSGSGARSVRVLPLTPHTSPLTLVTTQGYRIKSHGQLVSVSLTCCHASTPDLSTRWSTATLQVTYITGRLISRQVSRLDAFSAYPFRRSLTSRALGRTTGTRELRPSRSSRTRDSLPQVSYGCSG